MRMPGLGSMAALGELESDGFGAMFLFGDLAEPGVFAVGDVEVGAVLVGRCAVPVDNAGADVNGLAFGEFDDRAALHLDVGDAFFDKNDLADGVAVPLGAGAGGEVVFDDGAGVVFGNRGDFADGEIGALF